MCEYRNCPAAEINENSSVFWHVTPYRPFRVNTSPPSSEVELITAMRTSNPTSLNEHSVSIKNNHANGFGSDSRSETDMASSEGDIFSF